MQSLFGKLFGSREPKVQKNEIQEKWGTIQIWALKQSQFQRKRIQESWGHPEGWKLTESIANQQGIFKTRGEEVKLNQNWKQKKQSWGNSEASIWGNGAGVNKSFSQNNKVDSKPNALLYNMSPNTSWGNHEGTWEQKVNRSLSKKKSLDSPSDSFFDRLKQKGVEDQTLSILCHNGITTLILLRQCSQESLVVSGIRLIDAIKLKQI